MESLLLSALENLKEGKPPKNTEISERLTVGLNDLIDFWTEKYLEEYIFYGGSRIQFLTGRPGSGKTHFLECLLRRADNYCTVSFSAKDIWLHDFKEIYVEIFNQSNIIECLQKCANKIIFDMAYDTNDMKDGETFVDYLSRMDCYNPSEKREIRDQLNKMFLTNPLIDNNFALASSILTGSILGYPPLDEQTREGLLCWLGGEKDVKITTLRKLGLSPTKITKYNARHMLRSLIEIIKMSGRSGLVVAIDDLDILLSQNSLEKIRYTKIKRNDAYESMRELIDEIDTLKNVMFIFSFESTLISNDFAGIPSYLALWHRMQSEINSDFPNKFANTIDLDKFLNFDVEAILQISHNVATLFTENGIDLKPVSVDVAQELFMQSRFGNVAVARQIVLATLDGITLKAGEQND